MNYKMDVVVENPNDLTQTMKFETECHYSVEEGSHYGNGYRLKINYLNVEQMPEYIDLRYDKDFNPKQLICGLCDFANYNWSGENGGWKVKEISIKRIDTEE